jgi:hypothetical protein
MDFDVLCDGAVRRPHLQGQMAKNLLTLLPKLTKQDKENIAFAVAQSRPNDRFAPTDLDKLGLLDRDVAIAALLEAETKKLLPPGAAFQTARKLAREE